MPDPAQIPQLKHIRPITKLGVPIVYLEELAESYSQLSSEDEHIRTQDLQVLFFFTQTLPEKQAEAIKLYYFENIGTWKEVGKALDVSSQAAEQRAKAGLEALTRKPTFRKYFPEYYIPKGPSIPKTLETKLENPQNIISKAKLTPKRANIVDTTIQGDPVAEIEYFIGKIKKGELGIYATLSSNDPELIDQMQDDILKRYAAKRNKPGKNIVKIHQKEEESGLHIYHLEKVIPEQQEKQLESNKEKNNKLIIYKKDSLHFSAITPDKLQEEIQAMNSIVTLALYTKNMQNTQIILKPKSSGEIIKTYFKK